jgi:hypothetical protein
MSDQTTDNTPEIVIGPSPTVGNVPLVVPENIVLQFPAREVVNTPTITVTTGDNPFIKTVQLDPPVPLSVEDPAP